MANKRVEKHFKVTADNKMNPQLKKEVQELRGLLWENLPRLHPRFEISQHPDIPAVYIQDTKTGNIMDEPVGLCDLHGAIKVLNWIAKEPK